MGAHEDIANLVKEAAATIKGDVKGAISKLESAYALAHAANDAENTAMVAEELSRAWTRRKSPARCLYFARKATSLTPERKAAWSTLAKSCELVATRTASDQKKRRARALYRAASTAFKKAASLSHDPEDKRWLLELAGDAARQAAPPK